MNKISCFLKQELSCWKIWEVMWLVSSCAIIFALSIYVVV